MAYEKNGVIGFDQQGDDDKWAFTPLTNWSAKITEEIELIDSDVNELKFVIEGTLKGQPQVQLQLPAEEFLGMNWHIRYWEQPRSSTPNATPSHKSGPQFKNYPTHAAESCISRPDGSATTSSFPAASTKPNFRNH